MSTLTALAYVSSASRTFGESDLERLLIDARAHNARTGITGTLLYNDGNFFQYLEGPEAAIDTALERIKASRSHHGLIQLLRRPVPVRHFEAWQMGFARVPASQLLQLAQADWLEALATTSADPDPPGGVKMLLDLWQAALRRP